MTASSRWGTDLGGILEEAGLEHVDGLVNELGTGFAAAVVARATAR